MFDCELLKWDVIAYIGALAFQLTGAILLIVYYCGKTKERLYREYFPSGGVIAANKNLIVKLEKKRLQECARKIYDNRLSFIYIAFGYFLSIFGDPEDVCKVCLTVWIGALSFILYFIEKAISHSVAVIIYREDREETVESLGEITKDKAIVISDNEAQNNEAQQTAANVSNAG